MDQNCQVQASVQIAFDCLHCCLPFLLFLPIARDFSDPSVHELPEVRGLTKAPGAQHCDVDMCTFGSPYVFPTLVIASPGVSLDAFQPGIGRGRCPHRCGHSAARRSDAGRLP
eukprot:3351055-Pyramimonas_sp.AAC.1